MSNVPAYPKNPSLHPEADDFAGNPEHADQAETERRAPVELRGLDLSPPEAALMNMVRLQPIRTVLIAASVGYLVGRLARF